LKRGDFREKSAAGEYEFFDAGQIKPMEQTIFFKKKHTFFDLTPQCQRIQPRRDARPGQTSGVILSRLKKVKILNFSFGILHGRVVRG
jgi:hypothetical protein